MEPNNAAAPNGPASSGGKLAFLKDKKKQKLAGIIAAAVILVGGGVAGAYYGYVVPNQPENVLKKSVENLLKKDQISGKGKASLTSSEEGGGAGTLDYSIQTDSTKNAFAGTFDFASSGIKLPVEARLIDKAAYLKVGDLSTIGSLVGAFAGPDSAALVQQLSAKISNQWIEFDESLLKTVGGDKCSILSEQFKMNDEQIKQLVEVYDKNMFINVKNSSSDTVNDKKVEKYELGLDKSKGQAFAKELENLDYFKKIKDCTGDTGSQSDSQSTEEFKGDATLTVWVDKGKKEMVKIELKIKDETSNVSLDFNFNNDAVNITKPEDAIPAMQLYSDVLGLVGGGGSVGGTTAPSTGTDLNAACSDAIVAYVQAGTPLPPECESLYGN